MCRRQAVAKCIQDRAHLHSFNIFHISYFENDRNVEVEVRSLHHKITLCWIDKYPHFVSYNPILCFLIRLVFSCDQAALQMVFSVCPSVTPFWLCSHHRIIMKFSGVITNDQSKVYAKGQGQRSKVKVTEVTTQLNRFRTVTPVWIHIWWWNDAYSMMLLRRGALLFFKVIHQISRSHGSKNRRIWPRLCVSGL